MSSSSEDSVDQDKLREAIDPMFIPNQNLSGYKQKPKIQKINTNRKKQSLQEYRRRVSQADNHMNLDVTPGFQDYVSKYLFNFLEKEIEEVDCTVKVPNAKEDEKNGIKLFSASLSNCNLETVTSEQNRKKHRCKAKHSSSESEDEHKQKIASVAVTYDWIIQQKYANTNKCDELNDMNVPHDSSISTSKNRKKCKKKKS